MQQEAIRAFRNTWKPRTKTQKTRPSRQALSLAPKVKETTAPRPSLLNPLPPPALAALQAVGEPVTGVRRRPAASELDALSRVVAEHKSHAAQDRRSTPPLPPKALVKKAVLAKTPQMAPIGGKLRNSREPTDHHIEILSVYALPPLPSVEMSSARDAYLYVDTAWVEELADSENVEDLSAAELPVITGLQKRRVRTLTVLLFAVALGLGGAVLLHASAMLDRAAVDAP